MNDLNDIISPHARYAKEEAVEVTEQLFDAHVVEGQRFYNQQPESLVLCSEVHTRPASVFTEPRERRGYYHFDNLLGKP